MPFSRRSRWLVDFFVKASSLLPQRLTSRALVEIPSPLNIEERDESPR
jgi:hypothetical protein